jgi:hypothetical protein
MTHLVKSHSVINGTLEIKNHFLESLEEAIKFLEKEVADYFTVFDPDGNLVHSTEPAVDAVEDHPAPLSTVQLQSLMTSDVQALSTTQVAALTTSQADVLVPVDVTAVVIPTTNTTV